MLSIILNQSVLADHQRWGRTSRRLLTW